MEPEASLLVMGLHEVNSIYKLLSPWFGMSRTKTPKRKTIFVSPETWGPIFEVKSGELFNQNNYKTLPIKAYLLSPGSLLSDCHSHALLTHFPHHWLCQLFLLRFSLWMNNKSISGFSYLFFQCKSVYFVKFPSFSQW